MIPRTRIVYITIDTEDHRDPDGGPGAHAPNFGNLARLAAEWNGQVRLESAWCARLGQDDLDAPDLLALILAGSFTEWVEAFRQPAYQRQLDAFCALLRRTRTPALAICGSHQLVGYAYGGWQAVGHMPPAGCGALPILAEAGGMFSAPNPRVGEVGVYPFKRERDDPILAGLPESIQFVEYHHDEVRPAALPAGAVSLLAPDGLGGAIQLPPYEVGRMAVTPGAPAQVFVHRPIAAAEERSRAQLLRYHVPPAGRLLYSVQFHPELTWDADLPAAGAARQHGRQFIRNFLDLAAACGRSV